MPLKLTIVIFTIISLLALLIFYFVNTFYYVSCLLFFIVSLLIYLVFLNSFSSMFAIILALIYIGAIIIFIGYVCAISPNPLFVSSLSYFWGTFALLIGFSLSLYLLPISSGTRIHFLSDFFYSFDGVSVFIVVIFMLFFILLVVSAQHFLPKGPFRSS